MANIRICRMSICSEIEVPGVARSVSGVAGLAAGATALGVVGFAAGVVDFAAGVVDFTAGAVGGGVPLVAVPPLVLLLAVELLSSSSNSRRVRSTFSCSCFIWSRSEAA